MKTFRKAWFPNFGEAGQITHYFPALNAFGIARNGDEVRETFHIDAGADISMASRDFCEELGLNWSDGDPLRLLGISPRPECDVIARVQEVTLLIREVHERIRLPIAFVDGDVASLLGREGFFDAFRIDYDKPNRTTNFYFLLDDSE